VRYGWSLERQAWRAAARQAGGRHWRRLPFSALHQAEVPPQSGVYAICTPGHPAKAGLFSVLYAPIYVGQSRNLRERFLRHNRHPAPEMRTALNCFRYLDFWFTTAPVAQVDALEGLLIECFGPPVNRQAGIPAVLGPPERL
jgi:hypothetical protein